MIKHIVMFKLKENNPENLLTRKFVNAIGIGFDAHVANIVNKKKEVDNPCLTPRAPVTTVEPKNSLFLLRNKP